MSRSAGSSPRLRACKRPSLVTIGQQEIPLVTVRDVLAYRFKRLRDELVEELEG